MHTQNKGYMEMSGIELSILPPQGLPFHVLQPTEQMSTLVALEVASRGKQTTPFQKVISRRHFSLSLSLYIYIYIYLTNGHLQDMIFLTILSYASNLFTSRRPRCCKRFLLKSWG